MLDSHARKYLQPYFNKLAEILIALKATPLQVTILALIVGLLSSLFFYFDFRFMALLLLWFSGLLDILDGTIARLTKLTTPFGTLLDLLFDRLVEMTFIVVVALRFPVTQMACIFLLCSIIFSFSIFLTVGAISSKKSEKTFYYQAGLAERAETFIVFSLIILFPTHTILFLSIFTGMIIFTGGQRFLEAYRYFGKG